MQPFAPNSTVWAGKPARSMISWHAATSREFRPITWAMVSGVQTSASTARVAAITSGLPL